MLLLYVLKLKKYQMEFPVLNTNVLNFERKQTQQQQKQQQKKYEEKERIVDCGSQQKAIDLIIFLFRCW